ncbi:TetR family transcriptional regulator [Streptomyces sp. 3MP-14]|uniref:TetR family transcriptional regulator n=1 Tax=Streptomyces mimosae TaxID=2586635 RepID=A0A5N6AGL2_9ACTN|nr:MULTISPECIES: TetR/AcrR family transcriptional regulator [Streptomyces]KAB8167146.1 TetR family transcriptional regulator [Streptomyces mimosae]KAB8177087.1 TetR family transcriptional regulator [Streptomyces sp. 3MP-14]
MSAESAESGERRGASVPTLRERRRAVASREILDAAERHITEHGPAALSLRAVARDLGMTVQALYHYFPSRDALVTELIARTYDDLADAVRTAVDTAADDPPLPGLVVAAEGYRRWAVAHPERFQLLYGTPLRHYAAPADGPTTRAVRRMNAIFERELFAGFPPERLAAAETPALSPAFVGHLAALSELPPPATALLLSAWGHMHGLVVLEVFGHTSFLGDHRAEVFRMAMLNLLDDLHARIPAG